MSSSQPTAGRSPGVTAELAATPFVDLVSFRHDGSPVHTPVWISGTDQLLYVSTFGDSWKVRRIRANSHVALAPCTGAGDVATGTVYAEGIVERIAPAGFRPGVRAHRRKYGLHFALMWPARHVFRLGGHPRVWLIIGLTGKWLGSGAPANRR